MPYAGGETCVLGDYVKNQWEQPGTVTEITVTPRGKEFVSVRWDDGDSHELRLKPATGLL